MKSDCCGAEVEQMLDRTYPGGYRPMCLKCGFSCKPEEKAAGPTGNPFYSVSSIQRNFYLGYVEARQIYDTYWKERAEAFKAHESAREYKWEWEQACEIERGLICDIKDLRNNIDIAVVALDKIKNLRIGDFAEGYKETTKWLCGIANETIEKIKELK